MSELPESFNKRQPICDQAISLDEIPLLKMDDPQFPQKLVLTFKTIGFAIIQNHGISPQVIDEAFKNVRNILTQNIPFKKRSEYENDKNRGHTSPGQQVLDEKNMNNQKKYTLDLGHPGVQDQRKYYPNDENFIKSSANFYEKLYEIYVFMMKSFEQGLGLPENFIRNKCCKDFYGQTLRYLYYPQVTHEQLKKTGKIRCGAHSDYGSCTLLFQKPGFGQNGLRALNSKKQWVKVEPPDYCMIVNLGDLFQHWTSDQLVSTIHRVQVDEKVLQKLEKGEIQKAPQRQSLLMFCDPDEGQIFQCLPVNGVPKYEPFNGKQYVLGRVKKTFQKGK